MKKAFAILLAALMLVVVSPMAQALDVTTGPASMARFFDARTSVFISLRIDDDYLNTLSSVVNRIGEKLPTGVLPMGTLPLDIRALLESQLAGAPVTLADVRGAVGDYVAFAIEDVEAFFAASNAGQPPESLVIALAVRDRARLLGLLEANIPGLTTEESRGFTIIRPDPTAVIAIGDEVMYIAPTDTSLPLGTRMATLQSSDGFQASAAAMPAASYNIYGYFAYADLFRALDTAAGGMGTLGLAPDLMALLPNTLALGATILDGGVLTIDMATDQLVEGVFTTPVTPAFGAFVPNNVDLLVWSADLNGYVNYLLDILPGSLAATGMSEAQARQQIANALEEFTRATGIRLQDDLLSWMTGDFAIYSTLELDPLMRLLVAGTLGTRAPNVTGVPVEFGVAIATNNPAKTAETVTKLTTLVRALVANATGVRVNDVSESGFTGIELIVTVPLDGPSRTANIDILLGSTDQIFFFGTTSTAQRLLAGDNVLSDPVFARALAYAPAGRLVQFVYTDGEGFAGLVGIPLIGALTQGGGFGATREAQADQATITALQIIDTLIRAVDHSIIASAITDSGFTVARATIALR
jgi:hypothetical protein